MHAGLAFPDLVKLGSSLRAGQYNLLLGAGVSLDSRNAKGKDLPSYSTLRRELCVLKGLPLETSLQRAYSALNPQEVADNVTERCRVTQLGPSLCKVPKFLWRRIFTLNIDNALELAYRQPGAYQAPLSYHFSEPFVEVREQGYVPVVHLHGSVDAPANGYVFSNAEYVQQVRYVNSWLTVLSDFLSYEPFIIAGTSLDEVDLEFYLGRRTPSTGRADRGPSILVEPYPTMLTRLDCEKYGLILFEGTIQQFIDLIDAEFPDRPLPIDLVPRTVRDLFPEATLERTILKFSLDFEVVPAVAHANALPSRFFYGASPTWDDLASNFDVGRAITADLVETCIERLSADDDAGRIVVLTDTPGSGKTTVIRRAAFELATRGIKVISCVPFSGLEPKFTSSAIDKISGPLVIVVDNLADQVSVIGDVLALVQKKDLVVLCSERSYRGGYIARSLSALPFISVDGLLLSTHEATQLIERYRSRGLLGAEQARWDAFAFARELETDSIAVACCRILKDFRPLDRIVESLENEATDLELKRYRVAALAQHCMRGGVRHEVLAGIAGLEGWHEQFRVEHPLPLAYIDSVSTFIVPMSAIVASLVLGRSSVDQLLAVFVDLGIGIASRVNANAVRARTAEARLAGRLFDYDQIVEGFLGDRADELYERIKPYWEWNSRYWIQVALRNLSSYFARPNSEAGRDSLQRARQFARHAVLIEHHPMSLTTLAKVLFAQMQADGIAHRATFDEAFGRVAEAINMEKRRLRLSAQPLVTLFRGVREYVFTLEGQLTETQRLDLLGFVDAALGRVGRDAEVQAAIGGILRLLPPSMQNIRM